MEEMAIDAFEQRRRRAQRLLRLAAESGLQVRHQQSSRHTLTRNIGQQKHFRSKGRLMLSSSAAGAHSASSAWLRKAACKFAISRAAGTPLPETSASRNTSWPPPAGRKS